MTMPITKVFCKNCGYENEPTNRFCDECGGKDSARDGKESLYAATKPADADLPHYPVPTGKGGRFEIPAGETSPPWAVAMTIPTTTTTTPDKKWSPWVARGVVAGIALLAFIGIGWGVLSGDDTPPSAARRNRITQQLAAEASGRRNEDPPNAPASANGSDNNEGSGTTQDQNASGGEQAGTDGQQASNDNGNGQQTGDQRQGRDSNPAPANDDGERNEDGGQPQMAANVQRAALTPEASAANRPRCTTATRPRPFLYVMRPRGRARDGGIEISNDAPANCDSPPNGVLTVMDRGRVATWLCCPPRDEHRQATN